MAESEEELKILSMKVKEESEKVGLKLNGPRDALTQKKAGFPCSGLNAGSYFISQDEGMTESPVETLEKAIVLHKGFGHPFIL